MQTQLPSWHKRINLLVLLLFLVLNHQATGSLLQSLISKRSEYSENCNRTLTATAFPKNGNYCKGTFDIFVCWPHSSPGNVSVPCPSFLPWMTEGSTRRAHRECLEDGSWRQMENTSDPWRDVSECDEDHFFKDEEEEMLRQTPLRLISVVGYSLSLFSLTLATLLMGMLRKLHCTRNYIHMNLFMSFILRAAAVISKEIIQHVMHSNLHANLPKDDPGWNSYSSSAIVLMCRFSQVCMEYFVACNYFWLLVEAIFLHTLLFTAVLTKRRLLKKYMLLGWGIFFKYTFEKEIISDSYVQIAHYRAVCESICIGQKTHRHCNSFRIYSDKCTKRNLVPALKKWTKLVLRANRTPVLFVTPWTVVKILYENMECWSNMNRWFWWIMRGPITLSVLIIFFIFIKILMLLLSKLKADQVKFTDYRYSLARATLVLIPLLGIHEVVFTVLIDECVEGSSRYARNFINLTLSSFQGFLVAVLYCFANGEVQAELKKRWQLFLFTNHFKVRSCFKGVDLKHMWKCSQGQHPRCSKRCVSNNRGHTLTPHPQLLQVTVHGGGGALGQGEIKGQGIKGYDAPGLDFLTRKSLSSSDGEMTLGETMEEILEESQF